MDLTEVKHQTNVYIRHPWELARFEVIISLLKKTAPKLLLKSPMVLDVGCGDLYFAEQFVKNNPSSTVFAIDNAFSDPKLKELNLQYQNTPINIYNSVEKIEHTIKPKADIVLLLDVIEHIENDQLFLEQLICSDLIGKETLFVITVPAYQKLFTSHDIYLKHYRRYNNKMLKELFEKVKLVPVETGYFFTSLLFPRIAKKWLEKFKKSDVVHERGIGEWTSQPIKDFLIRNFLVIDFHFSQVLRKAGIKLPGLSNYAICRTAV